MHELIIFSLGMALGAVLFRLFFSASRLECRRLKHQLKQAERTHLEYQRHVSDHFATTAELINQLTDSYRHVHSHLAQGAEILCDDVRQAPMLQLGEITLDETKKKVLGPQRHKGHPTVNPLAQSELSGSDDTASPDAGLLSDVTPPRDYSADRNQQT